MKMSQSKTLFFITLHYFLVIVMVFPIQIFAFHIIEISSNSGTIKFLSV
jgi:hypothetical protein